MWKESDLLGVFVAPLVPYMLVALALQLLLRWLGLQRLLARWAWNPPLAEAGLYVCILSLLVAFL